MAQQPHILECTLVLLKDEAVLVSTGAGEIWLPRSEIEMEAGMFGALRITMPDWLAHETGLRSQPAEGQGSLF